MTNLPRLQPRDSRSGMALKITLAVLGGLIVFISMSADVIIPNSDPGVGEKQILYFLIGGTLLLVGALPKEETATRLIQIISGANAPLNMKSVRVYLVIVVVVTVISFSVFIWVSEEYSPYLFGEDNIIENVSALLFLISFGIGLLFSIKSNIHRKIQIIISVVGLLGFLDEIGFGARIFSFDLPRIKGTGVDGIHDFFTMGVELVPSDPRYIYILLLGIILAAIAAFKYRCEIKEIISTNYKEPSGIFAFIFVSFVFSAQVIDLELIHHDALFVLEELLEMYAALALLFCSLSVNQRRLNSRSSPDRPPPINDQHTPGHV